MPAASMSIDNRVARAPNAAAMGKYARLLRRVQRRRICCFEPFWGRIARYSGLTSASHVLYAGLDTMTELYPWLSSLVIGLLLSGSRLSCCSAGDTPDDCRGP